MKTFLLDIFPKIEKFSEKLDNLTLLTNQHWVLIDEIKNNKTVYIFRSNDELLVSTNGKIEKAKWEYLGNKSLFIDIHSECYLFKHGFFDENILALKIDSSEEYAVFVNENKYNGELNSIERIIDFLRYSYIGKPMRTDIEIRTGMTIDSISNKASSGLIQHKTNKGIVEIAACDSLKGQKAYMNGRPAPDGKYNFGFGFLFDVVIKDGVVIKA